MKKINMLLLGICIAGLLNACDVNPPVEPEPEKNYTFNDDIVLISKDGIEIQANTFTPITTDPEQKFSAIIFIGAWAFDKYQYLEQAKYFANRGYLVLSYTPRGFHNSGGEANVAGPEDMDDLRAAVNYLRENTPTDMSNIGASGVSYGGGLALLGLGLIPEIKTAASLSGWSDLAGSLYGAQTPHKAWMEILTELAESTGRLAPSVYQNFDDLLEHRNVPEMLEWAAVRSPVNLLEEINAANKPVFISHNFSDHLFPINTMTEFYNALTVPKRMLMKQGIHGFSDMGELHPLDGILWTEISDWFDSHLKQMDNGIMDKAPIRTETKFTHNWHDYAVWPPSSSSKKKYYLKPRSFLKAGKLSSRPNGIWNLDTFSTGTNTFASTGEPITTAYLEAHKDFPILTNLLLLNPSKSTNYQSGICWSGLSIRGVPRLRLNVIPEISRVTFVAYLYDLGPLGTGTLITHGTATMLDVTPGEPQVLDIQLGAAAYDLAPGRRLSLVVDTSDPLYKSAQTEEGKNRFVFSPWKQNVLELEIN